jgi:hypothetical protein
MLDRLNSSLGQIRLREFSQSPIPAVPQKPAQPEAIQPPEVTRPVSSKIEPTVTVATGHVHPPIEWAVVPANVVVHHNAAGVMDYWQVPRVLSGVPTMAKVIPIAQNNFGTFVHHIAEGRDYVVTRFGDWIETPTSSVTK